MSLFRKPKRNVRQRQVESEEEEGDENGRHRDEDSSLQELQSNINKFKEIRNNKLKSRCSGMSRGRVVKLNVVSKNGDHEEEKKSALLSFEDDLTAGDDGEIFQVKKSSQSRRLVKQLKAERKRNEGLKTSDGSQGSSPNRESGLPTADAEVKARDYHVLGVNSERVDDITKKENTIWTLSGKEAEALHMEEEDEEDAASKDPLQKWLQSGAIPDAVAIHAARKKREALREGRGGGDTSNSNFISVAATDQHGVRCRRKSSGDDSDEEGETRLNFAGVRSEDSVKSLQMQEMNAYRCIGDDPWERQQVLKAMKTSTVTSDNRRREGIESHDHLHLPSSPLLNDDGDLTCRNTHDEMGMLGLKQPVSYNLQGIKDRLKDRLVSLTEVHRRHESDLDALVDGLITSQSEADKLERCLPDIVERHQFFQDLRGYVTDLVECFDEKLLNIKYLEEKYYRAKADVAKKLMDRRREDVRDQMKELSLTSKPALQMTSQESVEEEARQRRAAEREGRRRRRLQQRKASQANMKNSRHMKHANGMSSDDELSTLDQSNLGRIRQDVENQARIIMSDVVEDFSSIDGVKSRLEVWKKEDPSSYTDSFVHICLPKIFSPLVRLQLLFWNPLVDHSNIESMQWYKSIALYAIHEGENVAKDDLAGDPDRKLLSMIVEKVILVKVTNVLRSAYDPLSTTQTLRVTGLLEHFVDRYPTVCGQSKQLQELLKVVKEKLKAAIDNDVYIPIGYPRQFLENPLSGHAIFLQRQFWGSFKLYRNILAWQGILSDQVLVEMALNCVLNRYLVIGLGVMTDFFDVLSKCRHIVGALPSPWLESGYVFKAGLGRFAKFLLQFGQSGVATGKGDYVKEVVELLLLICAKEEAETLNKVAE